MLDLDSPKWAELHAFGGTAEHIPDLLRAVYADPYTGRRAMEDVWSDLWGDLYHQGTIYTASIAAVPHLVAAGLAATEGVVNPHLIWFCVEVEKARLTPEHRIPDEMITEEYNGALVRLRDVGQGSTGDPDVAKARRAVQRLLSKRRGKFLPPQKPVETMGGLFGEEGPGSKV